ncbi:MAG: hypothetical protein LBL55_09130, partial [Propionibacteriaceae bacterium]|nr:hypothetical protein [Propionibacteriaceae bacterium]
GATAAEDIADYQAFFTQMGWGKGEGTAILTVCTLLGAAVSAVIVLATARLRKPGWKRNGGVNA